MILKMKRVFCLLTALLSASVVLCFPTSTNNVPAQCVDPTFACQDLESARLCGVVKTCIHDIWSTMNAPEDNDSICDICKEMVKEARDQLLSNMTQEEIKEVFEGSCKLMKVKLIVNACIKIVDEFIPELVEMLASRMDPTMVCTVSGLCNLVHLPIENQLHKLFKTAIASTPAPTDKCDQCITIVTEAKSFVSSVTEDELKDMALKFCRTEASSLICEVFIHSYLDEIYKYLISVNPKSACAAASVCPMKECKLRENVAVNDDLTCEFCTNVLEHVKEMITANTTEEEFKTALLNFCKVLGRFSDKCTELVNDYYDMLFDEIKKMDTKSVCTVIGLCNNGLCKTSSIPAVKLTAAMPVDSLRVNNDDDETNEIFESVSNYQLPSERFSHPLFALEGSVNCPFCKAILFYVKTDLKGDRNKHAVEKALANVCKKWVKEFPEHCKNFLENYSSEIAAHIIAEKKFDDICPLINACPYEKEKDLNIKVIMPSKLNSTVCDLCKEAFDEIEKELNDSKNKKKVMDLFDRICNMVPQSLQNDCIDFVDQSVNSLFDILAQELRSDNICPALRLCPSNLKTSITKNLKDFECSACKKISKSAGKLLQEPIAQNAVNSLLSRICEKFSGKMQSNCRTFVEKEGRYFVNMVSKNLMSGYYCSSVHLCSESTKVLHFKVKNDLECDLCKEIVTEIDKELKDERTEEAIKAALEKVCSYFPASFEPKCKNFVDTYSQMLIAILAEEMDPNMVCAALNICPAKEKSLKKWSAKAQDLKCTSCQYVFHFAQEVLSDSHTQKEVKSVLKRICQVLPSEFSNNCVAFINEYGDSLLVLIAQEIDPTIMCQKLGICQSVKQTLLKNPEFSNTAIVKIDECSLCTTVVDYMDKLLEDDDVDKEMTAIIEKVCTVIPSSLRDKCVSVVDTYGPYILQMIGQLANSKQVCQEIDLCPTPAGHVHLLGGKKCTFGPSYWCQSKVHASACKANKYCKEKVWKN